MSEKLKSTLHSIVAVGLLIAALALPAILVPDSDAATISPAIPTTERPVRTCFPAELWSAPQWRRPCETIEPPLEDGSHLVKFTGRGYRMRCIVPFVLCNVRRLVLTCRAVR